MTFDQFQAMLQDNGLKLAFTPARAETNGLRGNMSPERLLFEKMMRAHADRISKLAGAAKMGSMGGDEQVSLTSPGPWQIDAEARTCRRIMDVSGNEIACTVGRTIGVSTEVEDFANALVLAHAFTLRGKLRRLTAAVQAFFSASLVESQAAARDAMMVMMWDSMNTLHAVYPSKTEVELVLPKNPDNDDAKAG